MSRVVYVGMDVDQEKIVVAKVGAGLAKSVEERVIANQAAAVKKYFAAVVKEGGEEKWMASKWILEHRYPFQVKSWQFWR